VTGPYSGCEPKLPPPNAESRIPAKWLPACLACAVGLALVARLTLRFQEPRRFKRSKSFSFSAKTNAQGRYRFTLIPKGTVRLTVTAEHHQTFSKEFEIDQDNAVLEVKLKPPQPLL